MCAKANERKNYRIKSINKSPEDNTNENYYADTAYRAKVWLTQPPNPPHKMSGMTLLPFGDYRHVDPDTYLHDTHSLINAKPSSEAEKKRVPIRFDEGFPNESKELLDLAIYYFIYLSVC